MNTRRYPRSTVEAFGCRGDDACAIERPRTGHRAAGWAMAGAFVYVIGLLIWELL